MADYGQRDPTSVVGRRVLAFLIDAVLGWAVYAAVFFSLAEEADSLPPLSGVYGQVTLNDKTYFVEGGDFWVVTLAAFAYGLLMHVILTGLAGFSLGKAVVGIRVVAQDGSTPGVGRAFVRWILVIVDAFPYFIPMLVGFVTALASKGHRRVGDMAAKTFVVARRDTGQPIAAPGVTAAGPPPSAWATPAQPAPAPSPGPAATPAAAAAPAPGGGHQPQWDAARNAWIAWDASAREWVQHDQATGQWGPISQ